MSMPTTGDPAAADDTTTDEVESDTIIPFLANADLPEGRGPSDCSGCDRDGPDRDPAPPRRLPPGGDRSRDPAGAGTAPLRSAAPAPMTATSGGLIREQDDPEHRFLARYKRRGEGHGLPKEMAREQRSSGRQTGIPAPGTGRVGEGRNLRTRAIPWCDGCFPSHDHEGDQNRSPIGAVPKRRFPGF